MTCPCCGDENPKEGMVICTKCLSLVCNECLTDSGPCKDCESEKGVEG